MSMIETDPAEHFVVYRGADKELFLHALPPEKRDPEGRLVSLQNAVFSSGTQHVGTADRPYNFEVLTRLRARNVHHEGALHSKVACAVGLGHAKPEVSKRLDPMCDQTWVSTLSAAVMDLCELGTGFLQPVRENGAVVKVWHRPAREMEVVVEDELQRLWHYRSLLDNTIFARWGDAERLRAKGVEQVQEVIVMKRPTNLSLWWGYIDWLSAIPHIDLGCSAVQHMFDFHNNRGVPEMLITVTGGKITAEVKASIKAALQANVGAGNTHKSSLLNIPNSNVKVEVHKLALDGAGDAEFHAAMMETVATAVVTAHRIPPSLGGLLIPGKMGAANESSNALMVWQALVIGPLQDLVETILEQTIGSELGLGDMVLKTVIDEVAEQMKKLQPLDTMGRMKDSLPGAAAGGRNLSKGLKNEDVELLNVIPQPRKGESRDEFVSRFMGDEVMKREFPDQDQRLAVAFRTWAERKKA